MLVMGRRSICLIVILLAIVLLAVSSSAEQIMTAHFLYVGQGEATLLMGPDFAVLIDAGDVGRYDIVPQLETAGVEYLDVVVNTHPHADHLGQLPDVMEAFPVHEVWMSGKEHYTVAYEEALDAILDSSARYLEPRAGEKYSIGSLQVEVLHPQYIVEDIHASFLALRVQFGDFGMLLTGDIEHCTEAKILEGKHNVQAQVLQLGHHASRTSSSDDFLDAVAPEIAIYSAGFCNSYGHPHAQVVERILRRDITLYGTEAYGTIVVATDGTQYWVTPERQPELRGGRFGQIDINTARYEELLHIVHIGEQRAGDILRLRPFSSLGDLQRITGVGAARVRDIEAQSIAFIGE